MKFNDFEKDNVGYDKFFYNKSSQLFLVSAIKTSINPIRCKTNE